MAYFGTQATCSHIGQDVSISNSVCDLENYQQMYRLFIETESRSEALAGLELIGTLLASAFCVLGSQVSTNMPE